MLIAVISFLTLMAGLVPAISFAEPSVDGRAALRSFGNDIYVLAERTGGSDQEWEAAETALLEKWQHLRATAQLKPLDTDENGRNLLMQSAVKGYGFAVAYLLSLPEVREIIDLRDAEGLSTYDMAQLANTQTLLACHPDQEKMNPFVLVPFLVTQPYYTSRAPFPEVTRMLAQAGATEDLSGARRFWLERCSNKDAKLRARIGTTPALHEQLIMEQARQVRLSCFTRAARSMEQVRELLAESWSGERMAIAEVKFHQETLEKCGGTRWPDEVPYSQ